MGQKIPYLDSPWHISKLPGGNHTCFLRIFFNLSVVEFNSNCLVENSIDSVIDSVEDEVVLVRLLAGNTGFALTSEI